MNRGTLAVAVTAFLALFRLHATWPVWSDIEIDPGSGTLTRWQTQPRAWAPVRVRIGDGPWISARARIKGHTGSFQTVEAHPSLTLDFDSPQPRFDLARRIHLENGAEDPAHLHVAWGAEAFRIAGIPSPRVGWGRITLGKRSLGWVAVREGLGRSFIRQAWGNDPVALGEPAAGSDVGDPIEWKEDSDTAVTDSANRTWRDLGVNIRQGWTRASESGLDAEQFLTFAATEILVGHRDGYALARNNYRVAMTRTGLQFIPWGMDQLMQSPSLTVWPDGAGNLARALLSNEESRVKWAQRLRELAPLVLDVKTFREWSSLQGSLLRPHLTRAESRTWDQHIQELETNLTTRARHVASEWAQAIPTAASVASSPSIPSSWTAVGIPADGQALESIEPDGTRTWMLVAGKQTSASWTAAVRLPPGRYRFEGRIRTAGVQRLPFGTHQGASLRIGGIDARSESVEGDTPWRTVGAEFNIASSPTSVSLICELRARSGQAWFDRDSLKLLRIE
jgi:hypothetical protein